MLALQDASEQPAALVVLKALYAVKPLPELLSELSQEQQLQAALLADMWQVPDVSTAAVRLLKAAAGTQAGLSEAVRKEVLGLQAIPACLQPLVQHVALTVLGDRGEAVWSDAALQEVLVGLPLPVMEVLLACGKLQVRCWLCSLCICTCQSDVIKGRVREHTLY